MQVAMQYAISAGLASFYVGLGIILIFTLGVNIPVEYRPLVMGSTFGIALSLVIMMRVDLFTGSVMHATSYMLLQSGQRYKILTALKSICILAGAYVASLCFAILLG